MNPDTQITEEPSPKRQGFFRSSAYILSLVAVLLCLLVVAIIMSRSKPASAPSSQNPTVSSSSSLSLSPTGQTVSVGDTISIAIWEDSSSLPVNAVQANISYPEEVFEFQDINTAGSAFSVEAESSHTDGKVVIARGNTSPLTGKQLVATVNLKAIDSADSAKIELGSKSSLWNSKTNKDILGQKISGKYTVKDK